MNLSLFKSLVVVLLAFSLLACGAVDDSSNGFVGSAEAVTPASLATNKGEQTAVFAGGCFWGVEAVFEHVNGVREVTSGYSGGAAQTAGYVAITMGKTGHAEAVRVTFDSSEVSYQELLEVFFSVAHDPTELNRQGPDVGTQYRSAIFYANDEQRRLAQSYVDKLNESNVFSGLIVTQLVPLEACYQAEDYHQNYLKLHPDDLYIVINDQPKIERLRRQFPKLYVATKPL